MSTKISYEIGVVFWAPDLDEYGCGRLHGQVGKVLAAIIEKGTGYF
jgi:hypothetical protein